MALTAKRPEDLFEYGDIDDIKAAYRRLASAHHPDKGGDAADFQLVKNLYEAALKKIESGEPWDDGASLVPQIEKLYRIGLGSLAVRPGDSGAVTRF